MVLDLFTAEQARAQRCISKIDTSSELTWVLSEIKHRCYLHDSLFWTTKLSEITIRDLECLGYSVVPSATGGAISYTIKWN